MNSLYIYMHTKQGVNTGFHQVATHSTSMSHRPSKSLHEEMDFTWPNGELVALELKKAQKLL